MSITAAVKGWVGRRAMSQVTRDGLDLSKLSYAPRSLTMPLRRVGVDPVPALAAARAEAPVKLLAHLFGMNIWLVSGHPEVRAALADSVTYSTDIRPLVGGRDEESREIGGLGFTDPPEHTRLRKYYTPEFTRHRLAELRPRIVDIVDHQLDLMEDDGPAVDLVESFAFPIPFLTICELLGLPVEDRTAFYALGAARFDVSKGGTGAFGAASKSRAFLFEAVRRQRQHPGDGLIGRLIREHGDDISDNDLAGLADGVFLGGYETSASMLSLGALVLLQHREHFELVRDDPDTVAPVVEELLRYLAVVQVAFGRFAKVDHDLFGVRISAGDVLLCSLSGSGRDPRMGVDLDAFDPHRPPLQHFAFGHGIHRCVGAELARMELRTAYPALARRFPDLALAVDARSLRFRDLSIVYGVDRLPVRLDGAGVSSTRTRLLSRR